MRLELELAMDCDLCDGWVHKHAPHCPRGALRAVFDGRALLNCPTCGTHTVELNNQDLWECRSCQAQFSAGYAGGEDLSELERAVLLEPTPITVAVLSARGRGDIRFDQLCGLLVADIGRRHETRRETLPEQVPTSGSHES